MQTCQTFLPPIVLLCCIDFASLLPEVTFDANVTNAANSLQPSDPSSLSWPSVTVARRQGIRAEIWHLDHNGRGHFGKPGPEAAFWMLPMRMIAILAGLHITKPLHDNENDHQSATACGLPEEGGWGSYSQSRRCKMIRDTHLEREWLRAVSCHRL